MAPAQTHLHITACPYAASELVDLVRFQQKPRESVPAWLLQLWEVESVVVSGPEVSKIASI